MKRIMAVWVLAVAGLLVGVTASSVVAATTTTVTWKVSSLTADQVKKLSDVATSNSPGVKTWSKTGSCTLTPKSKPTKLTMGAGGSCTLKLKIAKAGNYPAKTSSKTITRKTYKVGQTGPGGGTIFYVDLTRPEGSRYFEVAPSTWRGGNVGPLASWGCYGDPIAGARGIAIGTGEQNTAAILAECTDARTAAQIVDDYTVNDWANSTLNPLYLPLLSDWFLPSQDELNEVCKWAYGDTVNAVCNNNGAAGLTLTDGNFLDGSVRRNFWSSSQYKGIGLSAMTLAHSQLFGIAWGTTGGQLGGAEKNDGLYVRPIRSF